MYKHSTNNKGDEDKVKDEKVRKAKSKKKGTEFWLVLSLLGIIIFSPFIVYLVERFISYTIRIDFLDFINGK